MLSKCCTPTFSFKMCFVFNDPDRQIIIFSPIHIFRWQQFVTSSFSEKITKNLQNSLCVELQSLKYDLFNNAIETYSLNFDLIEREQERSQTWKMYRESQALLGYFFLTLVNFWSEHMRFLSRMAKFLSSMLFQAVRVNLFWSW